MVCVAGACGRMRNEIARCKARPGRAGVRGWLLAVVMAVVAHVRKDREGHIYSFVNGKKKNRKPPSVSATARNYGNNK